MTEKAIKGYKVTDSERKIKIGIAAKNLAELKKKTLKKLETSTSFGDKSSLPKDIYFQLVDGTRVDSEEYFQTLPSQTTLVWVEEGKIAETDAERLYRTIREVNIEYLTAGAKVQEFVLTKLKSQVFKLAQSFDCADNNKVMLSTRLEHPEWFEGIDTRSKTKEEYLFRRSQDRIRSYYYKTKDELKIINTKEIIDLLNYILKELKRVNYFGCYFDRSCYTVGDTELKCLCDHRGTFQCAGRWDHNSCEFNSKHTINPYSSRENRILFQTWNLDHKVERSRFIIPTVIKLQNSQIDFEKVFSDLFTTDNLKLVHIVCHDKSKHLLATSNYSIDNCIKKS